ncbi:MAG TPA: patatin-like phospholipase family protein [Frankiaceae bacterium]|nr:patatin-like phospholipase family protein [Frankiaceae bacterium]
MPSPVTAFVLSGGGSLGAVQVGMLQELSARGVRPDLLLGTSAGALNAAYVAGHGDSETSLSRLEAVWRGLRRRDVFPLDPLRAVAAVTMRAPSLCSPAALRRLVSAHLAFRDLEDARVPVHLVATDIRSGEEVILSSGDACDAVLASAAIPGIFPSVTIDGRDLVDGGIANNAAVSQAVALGAECVYVLPSGYACALEHAPRTALGSAVQSMALLVEQRLVRDVSHFADRADVRVLPPLCPLAVSSADFRHAGALITRARTSTKRWLDAGGPSLPHQERFLSMHGHATPRRTPWTAPCS